MRKLTLAEMQTIAEEQGGKCLSSEYVNSQIKLEWECSERHQWEAVPSSIKQGTWCRKCATISRAQKRKGTIEEMQGIAEKRGGKCLSSEYVNNKTKLLWECAKGHQWEATPDKIKQGRWCPQCAGKQPGTIEEMRAIAKERGGKCLSAEYVNNRTKLQWQCAEGHQWEARPSDVKQETWCPQCGRDRINRALAERKLTIEEMQFLAESRGGKCLSSEYVNKETKLKWQCAKEHKWRAIPNSVKRGSWCLVCAGLRPGTIEEMLAIAKEKGGKCLSKKYLGAHKKLLWECSESHQWDATPNNIKRGSWCLQCSNKISERICREAFEQIFQTDFKTRKSKWLVNEDSNKLELDGYSPTLKLAFEHQGEQHFKITYYTPTPEKLERRIRDDHKKKELCEARGITLIEVETILDKFGHFISNQDEFNDQVKHHIGKLCKRKGVLLPENFESLKLDLSKAYQLKKLAEMQKIAKARGGECLSKHYITSAIKLEFKCAKGHRWKAVPDSIKQRCWCPDCAGKRKGTLEAMQKIATSRGGQCLSSEYVNANIKLKWECAKSHQWAATPSNIKRGNWCLVCAGKQQGTLEEMRSIAEEKGGKCLSSTYVNSHTKLQWQCSAGHQWEATPSNIKNNGRLVPGLCRKPKGNY